MENLQQERKSFESLGLNYATHDQVTTEKVVIAEIENYCFIPPHVDSDDVVIYLHGGGFIYGSIHSHRAMVSHFAAALKRKILFVEYSLAPENPFPHAVNEATAVLRELLDQSPELTFSVMGDSAGGNLAMSTALNLKKLNLPLPAAQVLISPWINMETGYASYRENEKNDPILTKGFIEYAAALYTGGVKLSDPLASPVHGSHDGLNPTLIVTGANEILRDDAVYLHEALEKAGCSSQLRIFPKVTHVWTLSNIASADSVDVMRMMKEFLNTVNKNHPAMVK